MNRIIQLLLSTPCLMILAAGCGEGSKQSQLNAITDPDHRPVQTVESFWLYENNAQIGQAWSELPDSDIKYFPALMPTSMKDYFWTANKKTTVKLTPDRFRRHVETTIPRIEFPVTGGSVQAMFQHDLFDQIDVIGADYTIAPTFEVSGKINRKDFGLSYNALTEAGGLALGEDVRLVANIQIAKQPA